MTDSILNTIKKMLGLPAEDTSFDTDIIVNINTAFMVLNQLGIGPAVAFTISDSTTTWESFSEDINLYSAAKTYIYLKVRLAFDPSATGVVLDVVKSQILEMEWRLVEQYNLNNPPPVDPPEDPDL